MPQPDYIIALDIELPDPADLDPDMAKYFRVCEEKLGMVPNVLKAHSFDQDQLRAFAGFYNNLMLEESGLTPLEREMIAVVVSSANHCYYCLVAHGAAVREMSGDPELGEMLVMNYRVAPLAPRTRAMLDFAWKLTVTPQQIGEEDREALRSHGLGERDMWDIAAVASFFNMSNRMAMAVDMMPNREYHAAHRTGRATGR
ncbi:peroxidase-related enzyme [Lentisalinibacter salinarum]|uniref:peroxidase-related enzyme n=1 Tax=Lentisalinibacter salinarum TaxID=2992239 RepID=UPI00386E51F1